MASAIDSIAMMEYGAIKSCVSSTVVSNVYVAQFDARRRGKNSWMEASSRNKNEGAYRTYVVGRGGRRSCLVKTPDLSYHETRDGRRREEKREENRRYVPGMRKK